MIFLIPGSTKIRSTAGSPAASASSCGIAAVHAFVFSCVLPSTTASGDTCSRARRQMARAHAGGRDITDIRVQAGLVAAVPAGRRSAARLRQITDDDQAELR